MARLGLHPLLSPLAAHNDARSHAPECAGHRIDLRAGAYAEGAGSVEGGMKILIACEESGAVRDAFIKGGGMTP